MSRTVVSASPPGPIQKPPVTVGNTDNGVKKPADSASEIHTVLGEDALQGQRIAAGEVLSLADICAGRTSFRHCGIGGGRFDPEYPYSVATVAVDAVAFSRPVYHGEHVKIQAEVINVGASSMSVRVRCTRDVLEFLYSDAENEAANRSQHDTELICTAVFHMVCIGKDLRPAKVVPALLLETDEFVRWSESVVARRRSKAEVEAVARELPVPSAAALRATDPNTCHHRVPIPATTLVLHRIFFPGHVNLNNTVFGGEIMLWMERGALQCGRRFCRNVQVHTFAMHNLTFKKPIFVTDWVRVEARVVYVRTTTIEVETEVLVERKGETFSALTGLWVLASLDAKGQRLPVPLGLQLSDDDPESLIKYSTAKVRYEWSMENKEHMFR